MTYDKCDKTTGTGQQGAVDSATETAIADTDLAGIFEPPLIIPQRIVLAVSGGADSIALMHLFARLLRNIGVSTPLSTCKTIVATVDHGLRDSSREEAEFVATQAKALGLKHVTLRWLGEKPKTRIQEAARNARYRLLHECAAEGTTRPAAVILAHHQGDQAETFLMRLARGSGIDGLAAMRREFRSSSGEHNTILWRPFLNIPKSRLVATLQRDGVSWIEDPSNDNIDFERIRIRTANKERETLGLNDAALVRSARRIERASTALEHAASQAFVENVQSVPNLFCHMKASLFATLPEEIAIRVLTKAVSNVSNSTTDPNLAKIEGLFERIRHAVVSGKHAFQTTLGGCAVTIDTALFPTTTTTKQTRAPEQAILIYLEPGRTDTTTVQLEPGQTASWAGGFRAHLPVDATRVLTLRALGSDNLVELANAGNTHARAIPARVAPILPSFWHNERLVHVPHLKYIQPEWADPAPNCWHQSS